MTPVLWHDLAVAGGGTLLLAVFLTAVGRALLRAGAGPLVTRKIPHALCGVFAALAAFQLSSRLVVVGVLAVATVALAVIVEKGLVPVPGVFDGTRGRDYGLVGFAAGALVAVLAFWPDRIAVAAGVLVLGLADAGAALVGNRVGRHPVAAGGGVRSLEGSAVFVAIALLVTLGCCLIGYRTDWPVAIAVAVFVAATTAAIELLVLPAADNLLITPWVAWLLHISNGLTPAAALRWLMAAVLAAAIVPLLVRLRWLDLPVAIAAGLVMTVAVGLGGWLWAAPTATVVGLAGVRNAYRRKLRR